MIVGVFLIFYGLNIMVFWGEVSLVMVYSEAYMYKNVVFFVLFFAMMIVYLIYGAYSNK